MLVKTVGRRGPSDLDEEGMTLVAVLAIVLIEFLAALLVVATVGNAVTSNVTAAERVQVQVAAESGRDAALAALGDSASCASTITGSDPAFTATIYSSAAAVAPADASALVASCPGPRTNFVVIRSTSIAAEGISASVEAVYAWAHTSNRLGGAIGSSAGMEIKGGARYTGDVLLTSGDLTCMDRSQITGNIYIVAGNAAIADCVITGNVSVQGDLMIGRDAVISGSARAVGAVADRRPSSPAVTVASLGLDIAAVREQTKWFDLDTSTVWAGAGRRESFVAAECPAAPTRIRALMEEKGAPPIVIDTTACPVVPRITLGTFTMERSVVLLVSKGATGILMSGDIRAVSPEIELSIVQTSTSANPAAPAPRCEGRSRIEMRVEGPRIEPRMFLYSPCGIYVGFAAPLGYPALRGQIVSSSILQVTSIPIVCEPFSVTDALEVGCTFSPSGPMTGGGSLGALIGQTEH